MAGELSAVAKTARRRPRQLRDFARQVRLVRVAGLQRGAGEVVARAGEEAAEAQHALERLGAVARGGVEAAPQLALGEAEFARQALDPRGRARAGRLWGCR